MKFGILDRKRTFFFSHKIQVAVDKRLLAGFARNVIWGVSSYGDLLSVSDTFYVLRETRNLLNRD